MAASAVALLVLLGSSAAVIQDGLTCATGFSICDGTCERNKVLYSGYTHDQSSCGPSSGDGGVWFEYRAQSTQSVMFTTCDPQTGFADTVIELYDDCTSPSGSSGCTASGDDSLCDCDAAATNVTFSVTAGTVYHILARTFSSSGADSTFAFCVVPALLDSPTASPAPTPGPAANDGLTCATARPVSVPGEDFVSVDNTQTMGTFPTPPTAACLPTAPTNPFLAYWGRWHSVTPPCDTTLTVSTCDPITCIQGCCDGLDTFISAYADCTGGTDCFTSNDDDVSCSYFTNARSSTISITANGGTTYNIFVTTNLWHAYGSYVLHVTPAVGWDACLSVSPSRTPSETPTSSVTPSSTASPTCTPSVTPSATSSTSFSSSTSLSASVSASPVVASPSPVGGGTSLQQQQEQDAAALAAARDATSPKNIGYWLGPLVAGVPVVTLLFICAACLYMKMRREEREKKAVKDAEGGAYSSKGSDDISLLKKGKATKSSASSSTDPASAADS